MTEDVSIESALELLEAVGREDPDGTLKLRSLLGTNPKAVRGLAVDDLARPRAIWALGRSFISPWAASPEAFDRLLDRLDWTEEQRFAGIEGPLLERVARRGTVDWQMPCSLFVLDSPRLGELDLGAMAQGARPVEPTEANVDRILTHWPYGDPGDPGSRELVGARLRDGWSAGRYANEELVCWTMTAVDGSLGFLHTLDEHRRRGHATAVTAFLVACCLRSGRVPFCFTESGNLAPEAVLARFHARRSERTIYWMGTLQRGGR